ncbi:MAG: hypothetical protein VBE63_26955 [Lamprobacter sp.]|uniref:hypothetical protein n=1 Tax=Lamprobacter sp. TaxID=3100796 RepID=UPI002B257D0D|nr:hypothetical protein [Lamprobacter sp.]MEA3643540.1 hypothetical protein [Lamprobacter sp.]
MKTDNRAAPTSSEGRFSVPPTTTDELAAIARTVHRYKKDQQALRRAMERAGIITESGQLSKEYQSR